MTLQSCRNDLAGTGSLSLVLNSCKVRGVGGGTQSGEMSVWVKTLSSASFSYPPLSKKPFSLGKAGLP